MEMQTRLGRRELLGWLGAGSALLSPLYSRLRAEAAGTAARPCLITMTTDWGCTFNFTNQKTPGPLAAIDPSIAAMAPHKDKILFINNFYAPINRGLHGPGVGYTGRASGGPSLDQYIGSKLGTGDPFPTMQIGSLIDNGHGVDGGAKGNLPVDALGRAVPYPDLLSAFSKAFGTTAPTGNTPPVANTLALDKSMLDFAVNDVKRLQTRLAGPERVKLEQYLDSLRGIESQLSKLAMPSSRPTTQNCKSPNAPALAPFQAVRGGLFWTKDDAFSTAFMRAAVEMIVLSIQCGMTTVVNLHAGGLAHDFAHGNKPGQDAFFTARYTQVAHMFDLMKATPWGNGTLLDNVLFTHHTDLSSHHTQGSMNDMVAILMGGLVSKVMPAGRSVALPSGQHTMNDIYTTMCEMMGAPAPGGKFGDVAYCKGALTV